MDRHNKNNAPDNDEAGEIMSWVIIFILMVAFWPIGLLLLLKKLNIFAKPGKKAAGRTGEREHNSVRSSTAQYKEAAREAENAAREVASDIAQAARETESAAREAVREVGQAARQIVSELHADLSREFSKTAAPQSKTWQDATSQSQSWQALASNPAARQSGNPQSASSQDAAPKPGTWRAAASQSRPEQADTEQFEAAQSETSRTKGSPPRKTKAEIKKERTALDKKSGKFVSVVLLLISIALFILGANTISGAARDIWWGGLNRWPDFYLGVFYLIGGFISFFSRNIRVKRLARYKRYYVFVTGRDVVPIPDIARAAGLSVRVVKRDIQAMINEGYIDQGAYIDKELNCLVISAERAEEARRASGAAGEDIKPATEAKSANQYMSIILELREINGTIADIAISDKIDRIEEVTAKIFRIVEEDPEKLPQIRRFMSYYLPTTLKLLRSYATLEKQGIKGENITSAKESIGSILDTLATGFEQQLDQLFKADAIDIAADINVLENLMQQDGLTGNKPELKTMEGV